MAKKAVLIGCNYPNKARLRLKGCVNDVWGMYTDLLDQCGFSEKDITVLIDTDSDFTQPTGKNIRSALYDLVQSAKPGDWLFVHFSGHGFRLAGEGDTGSHNCIVPTDMNLIIDDDFNEYVGNVPTGCRLTIVADSCYSGGLIQGAKEQLGERTKKGRSYSQFITGDDIPYSYLQSRSLSVSKLIDTLKQETGRDDINLGNLRATLVDIYGEDASPMLQNGGGGESAGHGRSCGMVDLLYAELTKSSLLERAILLTACQSDQEAMEASLCGNPDEVYGAFSNAIHDIIGTTEGKITYRQLGQNARLLLESQHFTQKPGLYCTDNNVATGFLG